MDWTPEGKTLTPDFLGNLEPLDVLVDFEGPRSFLARDAAGEMLFAHQCGESEDVWRYAVVPFTEELKESVISGRIDLWTALSQPRLWIVDIGMDGEVLQCVSSSRERIPTNCRPRPGVTLSAEHEPILSLRAIGRNVELGRATLSVLRDQLDSAKTGLRLLAEAAHGVFQRKGQPTKAVRRYYDLPAQLLAGSLQVSIYPPNDEQKMLFTSDHIWVEMQSLLAEGLRQIEGDTAALSDVHSDATEAVLKAIYSFAPPARGDVTTTEISGRLVVSKGGFVRMDRKFRDQLNRRLHASVPDRTPELFSQDGVISELDLEEGTCLLRDETGATISKLRFAHDLSVSEPLFEDVKRAFDEGTLVRTVAYGYSPDDEHLLLSVKPISSAPSPAKEQ